MGIIEPQPDPIPPSSPKAEVSARSQSPNLEILRRLRAKPKKLSTRRLASTDHKTRGSAIRTLLNRKSTITTIRPRSAPPFDKATREDYLIRRSSMDLTRLTHSVATRKLTKAFGKKHKMSSSTETAAFEEIRNFIRNPSFSDLKKFRIAVTVRRSPSMEKEIETKITQSRSKALREYSRDALEGYVESLLNEVESTDLTNAAADDIKTLIADLATDIAALETKSTPPSNLPQLKQAHSMLVMTSSNIFSIASNLSDTRETLQVIQSQLHTLQNKRHEHSLELASLKKEIDTLEHSDDPKKSSKLAQLEDRKSKLKTLTSFIDKEISKLRGQQNSVRLKVAIFTKKLKNSIESLQKTQKLDVSVICRQTLEGQSSRDTALLHLIYEAAISTKEQVINDLVPIVHANRITKRDNKRTQKEKKAAVKQGFQEFEKKVKDMGTETFAIMLFAGYNANQNKFPAPDPYIKKVAEWLPDLSNTTILTNALNTYLTLSGKSEFFTEDQRSQLISELIGRLDE